MITKRKEIRTEIVIKSTPEKIWAVLTDTHNYPHWNPFIKAIKGEIKEGQKISVKIMPPKSKAFTFNPTIITMVENRKLSWLGKFLFSGFFDGEHSFELIDNGNGTVTFVQSEEFKGVFVWLFNPQKTKEGFNLMNQKLKELAEN